MFADAIGGTGNTSAYFLIYMSESEYVRASRLAQEQNPQDLVPASFRYEISVENDKFKAELEEATKNSVDKKVERFITDFNNKLKGAQETGTNYSESKDMRIRSYFAFLCSLGKRDEMVSAIIRQCWLSAFTRGIDKDMDSSAFQLAMAKMPDGEALLRLAVDAALNPEREDKLKAQYKLFRITFLYLSTGINHSNLRKYVFVA